MIFDFDDHYPGNDAMPHMHRLKEANPAFKATLFAVPGLGDNAFWDSHPDWIELAVHGWMHPDAHECAAWPVWAMAALMTKVQNDYPRFVRGFKAPGWQISDGCLFALSLGGWWVADQPYNDHRRPEGLRVHLLSPTASLGDDAAHWHGHVQASCGNGIEETWDSLLAAVTAAESFEFVSEAVRPWQPLAVA